MKKVENHENIMLIKNKIITPEICDILFKLKEDIEESKLLQISKDFCMKIENNFRLMEKEKSKITKNLTKLRLRQWGTALEGIRLLISLFIN